MLVGEVLKLTACLSVELYKYKVPDFYDLGMIMVDQIGTWDLLSGMPFFYIKTINSTPKLFVRIHD